MNTFKKALMAAAVTAALGASPAAHSIPGALFDQDGTGGGGSGAITELSFGFGNALYQTLFPAASSGALWAQAIITGMPGISLDTTSRTFTYQFYIPVISVAVVGDANKVNFLNNIADTGYFKIFVDTQIGGADIKANTTTGANYGSNTDAAGFTNFDPGAALNGLSEILSGTIRLSTPTNLTQDPDQISYLGQTNGKDQLTYGIGGKLDANVFVTSQDSDYWKSDMIGTALDVDLQLGSLGPQAPFNTLISVHDRVVANSPDFGAAPTTLTINFSTSTPASGDVGATKVLPLNDFGCNDTLGLDSFCDIQTQITGSASLLTTFVPEPGSLALLGLGLAGLGFGARAKRRVKA